MPSPQQGHGTWSQPSPTREKPISTRAQSKQNVSQLVTLPRYVVLSRPLVTGGLSHNDNCFLQLEFATAPWSGEDLAGRSLPGVHTAGHELMHCPKCRVAKSELGPLVSQWFLNYSMHFSLWKGLLKTACWGPRIQQVWCISDMIPGDPAAAGLRTVHGKWLVKRLRGLFSMWLVQGTTHLLLG